MTVTSSPTPYPEVNRTLTELLSELQASLGDLITGVYMVGSLALGDFDPDTSDVDLIAVTAHPLNAAQLAQLADLHARFARRDSPWAQRLEVVYVPREVLLHPPAPAVRVPQVEVEQGWFMDELETGWVFQQHTLREHAAVLMGPPPKTFTAPSARRDMATAASRITAGWLEDAVKDPTWLPWVREPGHHAFVLQTLCRLLYSLATGSVTSKPAAVQWARTHLEARWTALLDHLPAVGPVEQAATQEALAFIAFTRDRARQAVTE